MMLKQLRSFAVPSLALLAAMLGGSACMHAQQAQALIIADGSLTMESQGTPWSDYAGSGNTRYHPRSGHSIRQVAIQIPGGNSKFPFAAQKCTIVLRYGSTDITVSTGDFGRGLQITTDFSQFHEVNPNVLAHKDKNSKITRVTVTRNAQVVYNAITSGGTRIEIAYE